MNPIYICPHIAEDAPVSVGLPTNENEPAFYCPECAVQRIAKLAETMKPAAIFGLLFVEKHHAREIVRALQLFTLALKESQPENSLVRNRAQCVARYIWNAAGLGTSKQERFVRLRYGQDDGIPSYKRKLIHYKRAHESKSLSNASHIEVWNRRVIA